MSETLEIKMSDLPVGSLKRFELDGTAIAVAHTTEGVFAVGDTCSHQEVSLSDGDASGCLIECWMHGAVFDMRTGQPNTPPATKPIPVFPVRISGDGADAVIIIEKSA